MGIINYTKIFLWSSLYYFQKEKSDIIFKIIVKNIKESGCVTIKLIQWILPKLEAIYDIDKNNPEHKWFCDLEEVYENCDYHDIDYTKKMYKQDFNREIDRDYEIIDELASGSIGQVYKIKSKYDGKYYAMKVIHPRVDSNLNFIEYFLTFLYNTPFIKKYSRYYFPIDINDFIRDFKVQTNMVNEGNNILHFNEVYKDQDTFIIPKAYRFSHNILIMSYEEATRFDDIEESEYMKYKIILLNKIFVKSNQHTHRHMHGDLHKGNWKVRVDQNKKIQIVIYDFGFCFLMPDYLSHDDLIIVDRAMITPISNIDNYVKACNILLNKSSSKDSLLKSIDYVKDILLKQGVDTNDIYDDPLFLINLVLKDSRENDYLINSFIFQSIIIHNQLVRNLDKYGINVRNGEEDFYKNQVLNVINICETYQTCHQYVEIIRKEYNELKIKKESLFECTDYLKQYNLTIN